MAKKKYQKLLECRGCSTSSDFSAQDKEKLSSSMGKFGMKRGTAYNRFFRDGFKPWQIRGITGCITDYCQCNNIPCPDNNALFFNELDKKEQFKAYMKDKGMGRVSVGKRFSLWNFDEWELMGIQVLLDKLEFYTPERKEVADA